jgi:hypothetical protein
MFNIDQKNHIGSCMIFLTLTYHIILLKGLGLSPDWHICWNMWEGSVVILSEPSAYLSFSLSHAHAHTHTQHTLTCTYLLILAVKETGMTYGNKVNMNCLNQMFDKC